MAHLFGPSNWPPLGINILHSLHGPGFAAIALLLLWYLHSKFYSAINYLIAGALAMTIGVISEIAQIPGTRDAQVIDLVVDGLGIVGALGIVATFDSRARQSLSRLQKFILPSIACIALGIACIPTIWYSYALLRQLDSFPVLLTFESTWERATIRRTAGERPRIEKAPGDSLGEGHVAHGRESGHWGVFLSSHPLPDWRGYSRLVFVAAARDRGFPLAICIRDIRPSKELKSNRFCKSILVTTTLTEYAVTFEEIKNAKSARPFDLSRVEAFVFSAAKPRGDHEIYLDSIRLE